MNKNILKNIGMTEFESEIYLSLLSHGPLSGYEVAEKTGFYRQVTYDTLKRLSEKGFVSSIKEGKTQIFQAANPEIVLEMIENKVEDYKKILPELKSINNSSKNPLLVEVYKGKNVTSIAMRDIINQLKNNGGEVLCSSIDESLWFPKHKFLFDKYEKDIVKYGIKEKVIVKKGKKGLFKRGATKYKSISEKYFNPNPFQVYENNVQVILWGNPDHLIIIRNSDIANSYRKQFEILWKFSK
jgi:HTH-type transcriptional regulator, sugar sensing transcriptional regulator